MNTSAADWGLCSHARWTTTGTVVGWVPRLGTFTTIDPEVAETTEPPLFPNRTASDMLRLDPEMVMVEQPPDAAGDNPVTVGVIRSRAAELVGGPVAAAPLRWSVGAVAAGTDVDGALDDPAMVGDVVATVVCPVADEDGLVPDGPFEWPPAIVQASTATTTRTPETTRTSGSHRRLPAPPPGPGVGAGERGPLGPGLVRRGGGCPRRIQDQATRPRWRRLGGGAAGAGATTGAGALGTDVEAAVPAGTVRIQCSRR